MKLYISLGLSDGDAIEFPYELPEGISATFIGLEIDPPEGYEDQNRYTIMQTPFRQHAGEQIHTVCRIDGEIEQEWRPY